MKKHVWSFAGSRDLRLASVPRGPYSSKRSNGKLLIVGGSEIYHGAPALASNAAYMVLAALRTGIGYVIEFVPKSVLNSTRSVSPDIIVRPLAGNNLNSRDIPMLINSLDNSEMLGNRARSWRKNGNMESSHKADGLR